MIIRLENLGPIHSFEFNLQKDFSLIVGGNSIGKSYSITIIYLLLKAILSLSDLPYFLVMYGRQQGEGFFGIKIDENRAKENPKRIVEEALLAILRSTFIKNLNSSLLNTFENIESLKNQFSNEPLCITLQTKGFDIKIGITNKEINIFNVVIDRNVKLKPLMRRRNIHFKDNEIIVPYKQGDQDAIQDALKFLSIELTEGFYYDVAQQISSVHYLPASRSGLYQALSAFGQIIAELSKSRAFLSKKIELPSIAEPLSDYFIQLSEISLKKPSAEQSQIENIASRIEKEILNGTVEFDSRTKRLIFRPDNTTLRLDLSTTSSMVSELSPIVSYLRYIIARKSKKNRKFILNPPMSQHDSVGPTKALILIEEPEAHLHPEIQVKLTEILAQLVLCDVKVILTSHSNYIFNKTNNLILSKCLDIDQVDATIFKMTESGSVGQPLGIDDLGIDDENFVDVAEALFEEKSVLITQIQAI